MFLQSGRWTRSRVLVDPSHVRRTRLLDVPNGYRKTVWFGLVHWFSALVLFIFQMVLCFVWHLASVLFPGPSRSLVPKTAPDPNCSWTDLPWILEVQSSHVHIHGCSRILLKSGPGILALLHLISSLKYLDYVCCASPRGNPIRALSPDQGWCCIIVEPCELH